jgi:hypothetical protein
VNTAILGQATRTDFVISTDIGSQTSFEVYIWFKCVSQTLIKSTPLCSMTWKNWGLSRVLASERWTDQRVVLGYTSVHDTVADISHR